MCQIICIFIESVCAKTREEKEPVCPTIFQHRCKRFWFDGTTGNQQSKWFRGTRRNGYKWGIKNWYVNCIDVLQAMSNWNKTYEDVCCETMRHNVTVFFNKITRSLIIEIQWYDLYLMFFKVYFCIFSYDTIFLSNGTSEILSSLCSQ